MQIQWSGRETEVPEVTTVTLFPGFSAKGKLVGEFPGPSVRTWPRSRRCEACGLGTQSTLC